MSIITPPVREQTTRKRSTPRSVPVQPARKRAGFGRARKAGLLCLLCTGLAVLITLHLSLGHGASGSSALETCAHFMHATDYTQAVNFQPASQQMAAVQMIDDLTAGQPAALVQVTTNDQPAALSVYVFGCALVHNQPQLRQIFSQQGLAQGAVELTSAHTLLTTTLDTSLSSGDIPFLQPLQQNIYREYAWQAGRFVQVLFPGFYPVSSRAEAQALQQNANHGQSLPWRDPLATAQQMARDMLHWPQTFSARLVSQSGDTAMAEISTPSPRATVEVTLRQSIQPGSGGLWFVTDARTTGIVLTQADTLNEPLAPIATSPLRFSGANALIDGQTTATLFDHTLTPLGHASAVPLLVQPNSSYSGTLTYSGLARGQQGAILIESLPQTQNQAKEPGQILLTSVILN